MFKNFLLCLFTIAISIYPCRVLADSESLVIYVDISEVSILGDTGTSEQLNALVLHHGSNTGALKSSLSSKSSAGFRGDIDVYNRDNIRFLHNNCDYMSDSLACGVSNGHWTLKTYVSVGDKYSTITTRLYDDKGRELSSGTQTAWGEVRFIPQWKLTRINQSGGMIGNSSTDILEVYPPKIEELPPLITPYHVWQSILLMYASTITN